MSERPSRSLRGGLFHALVPDEAPAWHHHGCGGACTQFAFEVELAAMHLDQRFGDGQAQPRAAMLARCCIINLTERLQHFAQFVRRNAYTCIADREAEIARPGE